MDDQKRKSILVLYFKHFLLYQSLSWVSLFHAIFYTFRRIQRKMEFWWKIYYYKTRQEVKLAGITGYYKFKKAVLYTQYYQTRLIDNSRFLPKSWIPRKFRLDKE